MIPGLGEDALRFAHLLMRLRDRARGSGQARFAAAAGECMHGVERGALDCPLGVMLLEFARHKLRGAPVRPDEVQRLVSQFLDGEAYRVWDPVLAEAVAECEQSPRDDCPMLRMLRVTV